jgi:phage recombination protein Bet
MTKKNEEGMIVQSESSALSIMADRFNVEPKKLLNTLKSTVFKNATNDELLTLVVVANEYKLNPLTRQIYAFPNSQGGGITPVVSVDGWISILNRHPDFDGIDFAYEEDQSGKPASCTAIIYSKARSHPVKVTEYFAECSKKTGPWNQMPRRMLRHKALIQCARIAFGFSGIYDEDEARDISEMKNVTPIQTPEFSNDEEKRIEEYPALFAGNEPDPEDDVVMEETRLDFDPETEVTEGANA